jgi:hypothetical protein
MKKEILIPETHTTYKKVEVEFPLYLTSDISDFEEWSEDSYYKYYNEEECLKITYGWHHGEFYQIEYNENANCDFLDKEGKLIYQQISGAAFQKEYEKALEFFKEKKKYDGNRR